MGVRSWNMFTKEGRRKPEGCAPAYKGHLDSYEIYRILLHFSLLRAVGGAISTSTRGMKNKKGLHTNIVIIYCQLHNHYLIAKLQFNNRL